MVLVEVDLEGAPHDGLQEGIFEERDVVGHELPREKGVHLGQEIRDMPQVLDGHRGLLELPPHQLQQLLETASGPEVVDEVWEELKLREG
jgi:hypothetical protein